MAGREQELRRPRRAAARHAVRIAGEDGAEEPAFLLLLARQRASVGGGGGIDVYRAGPIVDRVSRGVGKAVRHFPDVRRQRLLIVHGRQQIARRRRRMACRRVPLRQQRARQRDVAASPPFEQHAREAGMQRKALHQMPGGVTVRRALPRAARAERSPRHAIRIGASNHSNVRGSPPHARMSSTASDRSTR